jgi:hypothetical protein
MIETFAWLSGDFDVYEQSHAARQAELLKRRPRMMYLRGMKCPTLAILAVGAVIATTPAHAGLIADGITYTLTETALTATTAQFTLGISGIDGTSDIEKGRYGVQSFALSLPSNFSAAVAPSGFTLQTGGLNSSGCDGSGNFFCFSANTTPTGPVLAANSTLSFVFDLTISSGSFAGYAPDFKINWDGTKNNYDLVSKELDPTTSVSSVPEPASLGLFATGLLGIVGLGRGRRSA